MLSPADLELVRRDPQLPGLATVLDPLAMLAALQERWPGRHFAAPSITYLRYKPGTSCLAGYRIMLDGLPLTFSANARRRDAADKLDKAWTRHEEASRLGPGRDLLPVQSVALAIWPNDRRLQFLRHFEDRNKQRKLLAALGLPEDCMIVPVRHRPERRFVGQILRLGEPVALLKLYRKGDFARSCINAAAFSDDEIIRVPALIGQSRRHSAVATRWLAGPALMPGPGQAGRIGEALARLHRQQPEGLARLTHDDQLQSICAIADAVADISPQLGRDAQQAVGRFAAALQDSGQDSGKPPVSVHGDFYLAQLIDTDGGIGMVDFDEAAMGPAGWDAGNILGHLMYGGSSGTGEFGEAMLSGYNEGGGQLSQAEVRVQTGISLMRLAANPFRERNPDWPDEIAAKIALAESMLKPARTTVRHPPVDPAMPMIEAALDPEGAGRYLARAGAIPEEARIATARVVRHKPGRRCMIAYQFSGSDEVLLGKISSKGVDTGSFSLQYELWQADFDDSAADGIRIPQPIAQIPRLGMWLQRRVDAALFDTGTLPPARAAQAIAKLHAAAIVSRKLHPIEAELHILGERLDALAARREPWAERIGRLKAGAHRLAAMASPALAAPDSPRLLSGSPARQCRRDLADRSGPAGNRRSRARYRQLQRASDRTGAA